MPEIKTKLNLDLVIKSLKISKSTKHFLLIGQVTLHFYMHVLFGPGPSTN